MGAWVEAAGDQEHPESVVVEVAVAACDASVQLDDAVDGLRAAAVGAFGREVAQVGGLPRRRVRPRRAISTIGQNAKVATTFSAICLPAARSAVF